MALKATDHRAQITRFAACTLVSQPASRGDAFWLLNAELRLAESGLMGDGND